MNERLEQLMYESGLTAQGSWDEMDSYDQEAILKFAELIIRDCGRALHPELRDMISRGQAHRLIKEHFGVDK
jgi:hypothetical protein